MTIYFLLTVDAESYNTHIWKLTRRFSSWEINSYNFSDYVIYVFSGFSSVCGSESTQVCLIPFELWLADKHPEVVRGTDQATAAQTWPFAYPALWPLSIVSGCMITGSSICCCGEFWEKQSPSSSQDNTQRSNCLIVFDRKIEWNSVECKHPRTISLLMKPNLNSPDKYFYFDPHQIVRTHKNFFFFQDVWIILWEIGNVAAIKHLCPDNLIYQRPIHRWISMVVVMMGLRKNF